MAEVVRYVDPDASGAGDGTSWTDAYTSLNAWNTGEATDLVTAEDTHVVYCRSSSGTDDTTQVDITGWTTSADYFITVKAAEGHEASTSWDADKYVLDYGTWGYALTVSESYTVISGLQIKNDSASGNGIEVAATHCRIENCFLDGGNSTGTGVQGAADYCGIVNCIAVGWNWDGFRLTSSAVNDSYLYNCTAINCEEGIQVDQYKAHKLTNCYAGGCTTDYACGNNTSPVWTTCYSEDGTGTTTTSACSTSSGVYFTNVTSGSEDVSTSSDSDLVGNGTDLSSDGTYAFDDDIDGTTRSDWDVGAYEYVSAGGTTYSESSSDTATFDDTVKIFQTHSTGASDTVTFDDTPKNVLTIGVDCTDGLTADDTPGGRQSFLVNTTSGITLSDIPGAMFTFTVQTTDGITLSDQAATGGAISVSVTDGITLADSVDTVMTFFTRVTSGVVLSDSTTFASASVIPVTLTDGITLSDSSVRRHTITAKIADGVTFADAIKTAMQMVVSVSDNITLSDVAVDSSFLATGLVSVTISSKQASVTFTAKMPGATFTAKRPEIDFS